MSDCKNEVLCVLELTSLKKMEKWLKREDIFKNESDELDKAIYLQVSNCYKNKIVCKHKLMLQKNAKPIDKKTLLKKMMIKTRQIENYSSIKRNNRFDKDIFDKDETYRTIQQNAPKAYQLIKMIKELDARDLERDGRMYKHFIYSDVKDGGYGSKILASLLIASGFYSVIGTQQYTPKKKKGDKKEKKGKKGKSTRLILKSTPEDQRGNAFAVLSSTSLYEKPITETFKKRILNKYNNRPDNVYGDDVRIIILDSGFKEGVDLFDVRYAHIYERQMTDADEKQAIGRATRLCGQKGLDFKPNVGWELDVYMYYTYFDKLVQNVFPKMKDGTYRSLHDIIIDTSPLDKTALDLGKQLNRMAPFLAVDYELTKPIHRADDTEFIELYEDTTTVDDKMKMDVDSTSNMSISSLSGGKKGVKVQLQNRLVVKCDGKCGKRSTYDIPLTVVQMKKSFKSLVYRGVIPKTTIPKKGAREFLCQKIKQYPEFCEALQKQWTLKHIIKAPKLKKISKSSVAKEYPILKYTGSVKKTIKHKTPKILSVKKTTGKTGVTTIVPKKVECGLPPQTKLSFKQMRDYVKTNFYNFKWDDVKVENNCIMKSTDTSKTLTKQEEQMKKVITFTKTQDFIRHFFQPSSAYKGMLLWHSVGTGKTCSAIATASTSFERENYTIMYVTRTTLKGDVWKNIFGLICHDIIREEIMNGKLLPDNIEGRKRQLYKNWLKPLSYKQFSNMLLGKNEFYKEMVKRNGKEDILKNTLIIIDEAHKLYSSDMKAAERPDINIMNDKIQHSYKHSKKDSVRLLFMTATPFTDSPVELFKITNMLKDDKKDQITTDIAEFKKEYVDSKTGLLSKSGMNKIINNLSGYISYLNRSKDASQFTQVRQIDVPVLMSSYELIKTGIDELDLLEDDIRRTFMIYANNTNTTGHNKPMKDLLKIIKKKTKDDNSQLSNIMKYKLPKQYSDINPFSNIHQTTEKDIIDIGVQIINKQNKKQSKTQKAKKTAVKKTVPKKKTSKKSK